MPTRHFGTVTADTSVVAVHNCRVDQWERGREVAPRDVEQAGVGPHRIVRLPGTLGISEIIAERIEDLLSHRARYR